MPHRVSRAMLDEMARGGGGPQSIGALLTARRSRHLVLLRTVLDRVAVTGHEDRRATEQAFRVLSEIELAAPRAVRAVLDDPAFGCWVSRTVQLLHSDQPAAARPADLGLMAVAAAVRGSVPTIVDLSRVTRSAGLELPTLGRLTGIEGWARTRVRPGPDGCTLSGATGRAEIPGHGSADPAWQPFPVLSLSAGGLDWAVRLDPSIGTGLPAIAPDQLADPGTLAHWSSCLRAGWQLLVDRHRQVATDVAAGLSVLAPHVEQPELTSSTPGDAVGAVAMTRPRDVRDVAVALAHEVHHLKLVALMKVVPLVEPGASGRWYTPWRRDPRPAVAVLHGVYAHLGVAGFWRRERRAPPPTDDNQTAHVEFARWRQAAADTARTLAGSTELTAAGQAFVERMSATLEGWARESVPSEAASAAARLLEQHRVRWDTSPAAAAIDAG